MNIDNAALYKVNNSNVDSLEKNIRSTKEKEKLEEACKDFESIFVNQLMKSMRKTVNKTGLIDGGRGEEIFQSMLDEEYSKEIAKEGRLGISDMLFRQLSKNL